MKTKHLPLAFALGVAVLSLWLRSAFPTTALANAAHDDLLFVQTAVNLGHLHWLGAYSEFTLAKGAAYSAFIWVNYMTGLPLKLSEHAFYLGSAWFFASAVGKVARSRFASGACFVFLAFNPTLWVAGIAGRVVRENLYLALSILLVGMAIRLFAVRPAATLAEDVNSKRRLLIAFGVAGAAFWLTREEGLWLVPALGLLAGYWMLETAREPGNRSRAGARSAATFIAIPCLSFGAVVALVDAGNLAVYGVFRNNDFRSSDFQGAYGALARIRHDRWERYVVFPKDARERAYSVSEAARELRPFLDGPVGDGWRRVSCEQTRRTECPEILSGWFMWALRQSVTAAGHYRSAPEAQAFYRKLAREIDAACDAGAISCGDQRATMVPPWRESYLADALKAARDVYSTLVHLGGEGPSVLPSVGSADQIAFFRKMTRGRPATDAWSGPKGARQVIATWLSGFQRAITPYLVPAGLLLWVVTLVAGGRRMLLHPAHAVAACLVAAIAARVGLLGFLEATSIPSNNLLYLSPVVPVTLGFAPAIAFLMFRVWRDRAAPTAPPVFPSARPWRRGTP